MVLENSIKQLNTVTLGLGLVLVFGLQLVLELVSCLVPSSDLFSLTGFSYF